MLKIYYADALTDGEKFIFDRIDPAEKTILIVPDQFSLQAEEDALKYSPSGALLNLMVTDFSALGHKVVKETVGHEPEIIDKYGRHMLLSVLIHGLEEKLTVLRPRGGANALADQMNTMISEMKRYEIDPQRLAKAIDQLSGDPRAAGSGLNGAGAAGSSAERPAPASYLTLKLQDVLSIYEAYEAAISDIYQDAEDYITYYADLIPKSAQIQGARIWIYGFDTFTPKNLRVIGRMLQTASEVSVVMTGEPVAGDPAAGGAAAGETGDRGASAGDRGASAGEPGADDTAPVRSLTQGGGIGLFDLTEQIMRKLEETAEDAGQESQREHITGYPRRSIWEGVGASETGEPEPGGASEPGGARKELLQQRIRLVQASAGFEEAESAAAFIQSLVRDKGYRYGDIAVLCNDMDGRGRILRRAFERWDIPVFADQKRRVLHQPVVSFLLSFLDVIVDGLEGTGVMGMIKSGLLGWSMEEEALLENYVKEFRVRGTRWKQEFVWTGEAYSEEEMTRLNEMRSFLVSILEGARDTIGRRNTAEEKVRGLIAFLEKDFRIVQRIQQAVDRQIELGMAEGAAETAQIWNAVCGILDQIIRVIGSEKISNVQLREMISTGLQSLEIGLVPSSRDCVLMGTLQRSRPGKVRVLIVTGANAGLLPMEISEDGLLSRQDKDKLEQMELEFAGREKVSRMEEQLAIYRMFSLPEDLLYVSCSQCDDEGKMLRPSEIFQLLQQWQPEVEGDLENRTPQERVGSGRATVPYLAAALRDGSDAESEEIWRQVLKWYRQNDPKQVDRLLRGLNFNNQIEALGRDLADALYRGDRKALEVSASRLEKYSGCPFAHFIQYGLRAEEERMFEVSGREIGDVYHQCMMEFSRQLEAATETAEAATEMVGAATGTEESSGGASSDPVTWKTITEEQCRSRVAKILQENAGTYREGLFSSDGYSRFRMQRITEICGDVAWALVNQVRQGSIRHMYFEEPFGRRQMTQGGVPAMGSGGQPSQDDAPQKTLRLPAVEVKAGDQTVRIRGIIDRLDIIKTEDGQPDAVRIVDYKTGSNKIRTEYFQAGYQLQLMVYMDAALAAGSGEIAGGEAGAFETANQEALVPAGVFYYKIHDFNIDGDKDGVPDPKDPDDLQKRMRKNYRMEGIVVNDAALIGAMDEKVAKGAVTADDKTESLVLPLKYDAKKKEYVSVGGGHLLGTDEFRQLLDDTQRQVQRICEEICQGEIAAVPKRETRKGMDGNRVTACQYCGFRSICGFDPAIPSCRYEDV